MIHSNKLSVIACRMVRIPHSRSTLVRVTHETLHLSSFWGLVTFNHHCIGTYNTCSNALLYIWSQILLCGDVELNPGPTNGIDVDIDVHSKFFKRSLVLNYGFARVAIHDLSNISKGHHHNDIVDKAARLDRFLKLFKHSNVHPSFKLIKERTLSTYFDIYSDHILDAIHKHG